jgi:hypothetical protein
MHLVPHLHPGGDIMRGFTFRCARVAFSTLIAAAGIAYGAGCERDPSQPEVSPTELWRLELEQVDDGTTDVYGRLGTINLLLELNWTTTPDPLCEGESIPDATTFVATVEAVPSRLQPASDGSANGTWNCFGFAGEVRLDDGTTWELRSDDLTFDDASHAGTHSPMSNNHWRAGDRRGYFRIGPTVNGGIIFDTHLDAVVRNASDEIAHVAALRIGINTCFLHRDLPRQCVAFASDRFVEVAPHDIESRSWPNGLLLVPWPGGRPSLTTGIVGYAMEVRYGDSPSALGDNSYLACFLDPANDGFVEIIVEVDESLACGEGWLGGLFAQVQPNHIYLQPGETDTATVLNVRFDGVNVPSVSATSSNPAIRVAQESGDLRETRLILAAETNAGLTRHTVTVTLTNDASTPYEIPLPVDVYLLAPVMERDTIVVPRGVVGTASVDLGRYGIVDEDVQLAVESLPGGVFDFPPSFVPDVTRDGTSAVNLPIDVAAPPGDYEIRFCARILDDWDNSCHEGRFVLRVTDTNTPPVVSILSPETGYSTQAGNSILFQGNATDAEEGSLSGSALLWNSSINGFMGSGESVASTLSIGDHLITLTGTDSFGATASDSVMISIIDPNRSASIVGRVTRNGVGLAGATLLLDGPQAGSTTSSANGSYAFTGLPAGTYTIVVSAPGTVFLTNSQTVTLANGESVFVDFAGS